MNLFTEIRYVVHMQPYKVMRVDLWVKFHAILEKKLEY